MNAPEILLCIIAVCFLLGQIRLGCSVEYGQRGVMAWVHAGRFRVAVYPMAKKDATQKKEKPKKKKPKKKSAEQEKSFTDKVGGALDYLQQLLPVGLQALGYFRKKLRADVLRMELCFGASDPADAARLYGMASAALGALWYPLVEALNVRDGYARATPDFEGDRMTVYLYGKLSIKVGQILWLGLYFGLRTLKALLTVRKQHKRQQMQGKAV